MVDIQNLSFSYLPDGQILALRDTLVDSLRGQEFSDALIRYLADWSRSEWVDDDKLYVLARKLSAAIPNQQLETLKSRISSVIPERVALPFLSGLNASEDTSQVATPSHTEWQGLIDRIRDTPVKSIENDLHNLSSRQILYSEISGDSRELISSFLATARLLLSPSHPSLPAARNAERMAREAIRWAPRDRRLWLAWGRSYHQGHDPQSAEYLFWNNIRLFPEYEMPWHRLLDVLIPQVNRTAEAVAVARSFRERFPDSAFAVSYLARALIALGADGMAEAKILLLNALRVSNENSYQYTIYASSFAALLTLEDLQFALGRRGIMQQIPQSAVGLVKIAAALRAQHRSPLGEALMRYARMRHPNDAAISNVLSSCLVDSGDPKKIKEAIEIVRPILQNFPEDNYLRPTLVRALLRSSETLEVGNRYLRRLKWHYRGRNSLLNALDRLGRELKSEELASAEIDAEPKSKSDRSGESRIQPLPDDVNLSGELRRVRFLVEETSGGLRKIGLTRLKELVAENTDDVYLQMLAVRHGILEQPDEGLPSFAAAFEIALRREDLEALDALALRYSRLEALIWFARAMFGDPTAAAFVAQWSVFGPNDAHPAVRSLQKQLRPVFSVIQGGLSPIEAISRSRGRLLRLLRDSTEAVLSYAA